MVSLWDAALLGLVEGLTEFVPVSSTGHLMLVDHLLGHSGAGTGAFEIVIQLGALVACVLYYRRLLADMLAGLVRGGAAARPLPPPHCRPVPPPAVGGLLPPPPLPAPP